MAKTTLTLSVEYDPEVTDPESLACALDRVMGTALSTPDLLDEYGNPHVGDFYLLDANVSNFPETNGIHVTVSDVTVHVHRDKHGDVHVAVAAPETREDLVLGKEGSTQRV